MEEKVGGLKVGCWEDGGEDMWRAGSGLYREAEIGGGGRRDGRWRDKEGRRPTD